MFEKFSSFNASAARVAREAALLAAAESSESGDSESERSYGEGEEVEASSSSSSPPSSSSDDDTRDQHRHVRSSSILDHGDKKTRMKERKKKKKEKKKGKGKKKEKRKKKRERSRSTTPQQPQPPPHRSALRRGALDLPAPCPSHSPSPRDDLYYFVNYINPLRASSSSFFNAHDVVAAIDDAIVQRKRFRSTSQTASCPSHLNHAEAFVATVLLLLSSGNDEAAAARVSAFAEFHFLPPPGLTVAANHPVRLESFERFWESGADLCWEGSCTGWKGWFEAGSPLLPPPPSASAAKTAKPKAKTIAPEDARLAAEIAAEIDARVLELLPEGDRTLPVRVAERWAREEEREKAAAGAIIKVLRGPAAVEALAALSAEEAEGDPQVCSAFAPFASVRSAVSLLFDGGEGDVVAEAMVKMLSALGADSEGGGRRHREERRRWCLASAERREFLSRLLSALVTSSSALVDDAGVCWAALEIEAAEGEGKEQKNWERARVKAKTLLALRPASSALWRAFARLQAESGELNSSLKVSSKLLESLLGNSGDEVESKAHALAAAVEAADAVLAGNTRKKKQTNQAAALLVAAACGIAPSEVAVEGKTGAPTAEARAKAAAAKLDGGNEDKDASSEAAAAAAAVGALLLLSPLKPVDSGSLRALDEAEAAARLGEVARRCGDKNRPVHPRFFGWVVLRRCRMLSKAGLTSDEARSAVLDALERFPEGEELVDLLAGLSPTPSTPLQLVRDVISKAPSPAAVLRAIEVSRELTQSAAASAGVIEHVVSSSISASSPQLWRALARLELAGSASPSRARRALLRGVEACPWSRELYLDLVDPRALETEGEKNDIIVVASGERAQLLEAGADAGVLFRKDPYEVALGMAVAEELL